MCYLNPVWIDRTDMGPYLNAPTPEQELRLIEFFSWFSIASTHDDLHDLHKNSPELYAFYERNSDKMWFAGMTDVSIIKQVPHIERLNFRGVYEVSISETFIERNDGKVYNAVIEHLQRLIDCSPLNKMKVIIETPNGEDREHVMKLLAWAAAHNIPVGRHNDFTTSTVSNVMDTKTSYVEGYQVVNASPICILSESVHGQSGDLYLMLLEATEKDGVPYYNIFREPLSPAEKE